ncbi:MAG: hypothetical protein AAFY73_06020 [Pseudomonadota bacterium]
MVAATAVSFFVLVTFSAGFLADIIHFNDPRHQNEPLKPWMTPRYVALSYDLPRETVMEIFELPEDLEGERPRVGRIARRMSLTLPELTQRVRDAQAALEASDD